MSRSRVRSVARGSATQQPRTRVVVATEGVLTEPEYLRVFDRAYGSKAIKLVVIRVGQDPRSVVERAIGEKQKGAEDSLATRDSFWAMFDKDEHTKYEEARNLAQGNGIKLAISNPCFELWGILHYQDQDAFLDRHACQRKLRTLCPGYGAGAAKVFGDQDAIYEHYVAAVERASRSLVRREEEGTPLGNPSTSVYLLTEFIRCFKRQGE